MQHLSRCRGGNQESIGLPIPWLCTPTEPVSGSTNSGSTQLLPASVRKIAKSEERLSDALIREYRRTQQAERKRKWRHNQTPEQKEKRKFLDACRKRRERENQTEEQRAENRRKDAARKAAKREKLKLQMGQGSGKMLNTAKGNTGSIPIDRLIHVTVSTTVGGLRGATQETPRRDQIEKPAVSVTKYSSNTIQSILN